MDSNPQFLTDMGIQLKLAVAGFWGGVGHVFATKNVTLFQALGSVVLGTVTANYLGQIAVTYVGNWIGELGSGFVVGLCAMLICQRLIALATSWKLKEPS